MDHGRQTKDGVSLAGAGSEVLQTCSEDSPTSNYGYASCPSRCGCCLLRVCSVCRFPAAEGWSGPGRRALEALERYIKWFYHVSHPLIVNPAPEPQNVMPRPVY